MYRIMLIRDIDYGHLFTQHNNILRTNRMTIFIYILTAQ